MEQQAFIVTAWTKGRPGRSGSGYGLKIQTQVDLERHFKKEWGSVDLYLPNVATPVNVNIRKRSFWNGTCRELIKKEIGLWLRSSGMAPWESGNPPKVWLRARGGGGAFDVRPVTR